MKHEIEFKTIKPEEDDPCVVVKTDEGNSHDFILEIIVYSLIMRKEITIKTFVKDTTVLETKINPFDIALCYYDIINEKVWQAN